MGLNYTSKNKDYFWNTMAGIINAAEVILMSVIVMRFGKLSDAGILSLAFAVGNVLMSIGAFGGRMFQATDINRQYTLEMYLIHRICSSCLMIVSLIVYLFWACPGTEKTISIILITIIYLVEVLENCLWGFFQLRDHLYIGAEMFCTRWIAIISVFSVCMILLRDMTKALLGGVVAGVIIFAVWVIGIRRYLLDEANGNKDKWQDVGGGSWFISLTKNTFPLFAAGFCSLFINNVPKFAIDRYLDDEIQACYGFVAMPVFVIGLLNQFIYQPIVTKMSKEYGEGDMRQFKHSVNIQTIEVVGISAICVLGAAVIGIPVLSLIYNTNLDGYRCELVILQFAGGFLALSVFFNVILTIMRKQIIILRGYAGVTIMGILILPFFVKKTGTIGAAVGYLVIMAALFGYYYSSYLRVINYREDNAIE